MSAEEKRAVVTLHKGVNADEFLDNMTTTFGSDAIPARSVTLHNEKPDSVSNFDFVLTQAEAETLKNDPRVRDVRWGSKLENGFIPMHNITEPSRSHQRDNTVNNTHYPWAFAECTSQTSRYGGGTSLNYAHAYSLDGTGVDCVIQDSGIEVGHPEWNTRDGSSSRLKQIDWPSASGLSGTYTQGANHYTDQYGHGTHCASTTAGKLYGWANNSDIYAIKIFDTDAYGVSASFNMIRGWHNLKGTGRPTVVNMSWGYFGTYTNINGGNWRGTPWGGTTLQLQFGMTQGGFYQGAFTFPLRVTSVESDMEDCIADGVILVAAAGNSEHKMDVVGGVDYDNYFVSTLFGNRYYHRGGTPQAAAGTICVGAIDYDYTSVSADPEYNNGAIIDVTGDGSDFFKREVTVNGVRIMAAGGVGGQTAVPDAWVEKVARMFELFTDPNGAGINSTLQRNLIKNLSGDTGTYHAGLPTIQRVARGAGADYTPNFLTDQGVIDWNLTNLFDTHVQNDMVWYLNSTGDGYGDGDTDAQEVIEHVFHTLHMHGLPADDIKLYQFLAPDWQSGDLYAAMEEAYDAGKWDSSGYGGNAWKTDADAFEVAAKEYLYLLNFCMFEYTELWDGGSLAPEWTDDMRTQAGIQANNPLGYAFHNTWIAPVISKPSLATIRSIFQDGNTPEQDDPSLAGVSGYVVSNGSTQDPEYNNGPLISNGEVAYKTINIGALNDQHATGPKERKVGYSDRGNAIDVYAPADGTLAANRSYTPEGRYPDTYPGFTANSGSGAGVPEETGFSGTSAACPVAAGFISTLVGLNRNWGWREVKDYFESLNEQSDANFYKGSVSTSATDANWLDYDGLEGGRATVMYQDANLINQTTFPKRQSKISNGLQTSGITINYINKFDRGR